MKYNDSRYDVNWMKMGRWQTPFKWRKPDHLALLSAVLLPINSLHQRFTYFRNFINYRLSITPQVVYLEKLLNDRFDPEFRRIRIIKPVPKNPLVLFLKAEQKPKKLGVKPRGGLFEDTGPWKLFTKSETLMFTVDFIVQVPILVSFDMNELTAYLDIDVLPSKVYKVQII